MTNKLQHLPVSVFAMVMGLAGLSLAWRKAHVVFGLNAGVALGVLVLAAGILALLVVLYGVKLIRYPAAVMGELRHPVRLNFFPAISIALILVGTAALDVLPDAAKALWTVGALVHLGFTLFVMSVWIHHTRFEVAHMNPAWFIPVVGNVLVPIAGVRLYSPEISWFFFSIGIGFWMPLFTIVLYRLFFHAPLPERLMPTLFILIAPPAVGFSAYVSLTGSVDGFARFLFAFALVLTLLLASNALRFLRLPFFLSAWAYSFPLAAVTIAAMGMVERVGGAGYEWIAAGLLTVLTLVITALFLRTLVAVRRGEICVEEK